jgi:serine/threonine protein kinase
VTAQFSPPPRPRVAQLRYRTPAGGVVEADVVAREPAGAAGEYRPPVVAQRLRLATSGGTSEVLRLAVGSGDPGLRRAAYDALDNEALAGMRLARWAAVGPYPRWVSRLVGVEPREDEPFVLLEPLRGDPVRRFAGRLLHEDAQRFRVSLLSALRVLAASGLAHRGLSPDTVRWDGAEVQLTRFDRAAPFGSPRTLTGTDPWLPREQSDPGECWGIVGDRDDVWAAGRLLFFTLTGSEPVSWEQVARYPDLAHLLQGAFGPANRRPSPAELLARADLPDPVRRPLPPDPALEAGRREFHGVRRAKHPGIDMAVLPGVPPGFPGTAPSAGPATPPGTNRPPQHAARPGEAARPWWRRNRPGPAGGVQ